MDEIDGVLILKAPHDYLFKLAGRSNSVLRSGIEELFDYIGLQPLKEYHPVFADDENAGLSAGGVSIKNDYAYIEIRSDIWTPIIKPIFTHSTIDEAYAHYERNFRDAYWYSVNDKGEKIIVEETNFNDLSFDAGLTKWESSASESVKIAFPPVFGIQEYDGVDEVKYKKVKDEKHKILRHLTQPPKQKFWVAAMPDSGGFLVDHRKAEISGPFYSNKDALAALMQIFENHEDYIFTPVLSAADENMVRQILEASAWMDGNAVRDLYK